MAASATISAVSGGLDEDTKKLVDALLVPVVTPKDPSDDNILENLEVLVGNELHGEVNSLKLMLAIRKCVKASQKLIRSGPQKKAAIIYVCKVAVLKNISDPVQREALMLVVDEIVPEVIEMVVDAAKNPGEYKTVLKSRLSKLCACLG